MGKGDELPRTGRSWIRLSLTLMNTTHHTPKFQAEDLLSSNALSKEWQPPGAGDKKGHTGRVI